MVEHLTVRYKYGQTDIENAGTRSRNTEKNTNAQTDDHTELACTHIPRIE